MNWNKYPFLKLIVPLTMGIVLGDRLGPPCVHAAVLYGILTGLLLLVFVLHRTVKSYRHRWIPSMVVLLVLFYFGFFRIGVMDQSRQAMVRRDDNRERGYCLAMVGEPPMEREKSVKVVLELVNSGKAMAYFQKTDAVLQLHYGDLLAFKGEMEPVPGPKNPGEFDYRHYLERNGITGRVYLKEGSWFFTGVNEARPLRGFAYRFRGRLLDTLQRCGVTEDEFGIGAALLLGYDESLPAQVRQNFVAAGSMHILCVSGMHVGIVYLLASMLLGLLGTGRRRTMVRQCLLLLLIWFYALLTGLSPSVMRSALMLSFIILGKLIHRKGFTLNSIAASAFVLLCIDPHHLFAIGFQLSYTAVVGIVLLQKPIYQRVYIKNRLLDKAWEVLTVSLAAQIATMPFTIYYFHQFTPYFWLSNLLLTPLSFLVILLGMMLLALSWVPWLNMLLGKAVWTGLYLMNFVVAGIERFPMSLVKGLFMDEIQFFIALTMLLLLLLWASLRKKRLMMELLTVSVLFAFTMAIRSERLERQHRLVVYSLRKHTAIDIIEGTEHVMLCDAGLLTDRGTIDYSLNGYWAQCQLDMNPSCYLLEEEVASDLVLKRGPLLSSQGCLLALWGPGWKAERCEPPLPVDMLLVVGKQKPDLRRVVAAYRMEMLLIDGSVPERDAMEWSRQAESMGISFHQLADGAFLYNIENQ